MSEVFDEIKMDRSHQYLLVSGYLREIEMNKIFIPNVIKEVVVNYYPDSPWDLGHTHNELVMDKYILERTIPNTFVCWNAFSLEIVKKGVIKEWKLKILKKPTILLIGVVDWEKAKSSGTFYSEHDGYAYSAWNGSLFHMESNQLQIRKNYGPPCRRNDIIKIYLDLMNTEQNNGCGILRFSVNGRNLGIAYSRINASKTYKLAIGMHHQEKVLWIDANNSYPLN